MRFFAPLAAWTALLAIAADTSGQIAAPAAAMVRFADGSLRAVYGLNGNYVVGRPVLTGIQQAAFSSHFGLVDDGAQIILLRADLQPLSRFATAEAQPVFGVGETTDSLVAWLPSQAAVVYWDGGIFQTVAVSLPLEGAVHSISRRGNVAALSVTAQDGSHFEVATNLRDGSVERFDLSPPAIGTPITIGGVETLVRSSSGGISLESPAHFHSSQAWTGVTDISDDSGRRHWLLTRQSQHWQLAELPAPGDAK